MSATLRGVSRALEGGIVRVARGAAAHGTIVLVAWLGLTVLPSAGIARLERRTDGRALVAHDDPALAMDRAISERFDLRDHVVIHFDGGRTDALFDRDVLESIRAVTEGVKALPGIGPGWVMSLETEARDRLWPGTSRTVSTFLEPLPRTPAEMAEFRADLELPAARIHAGTIVSRGNVGGSVIVGVPDANPREALLQQIEDIVGPRRGRGIAIDVVGAPVASARLAEHLVDDLRVLVPVSMVLLSVVILAITRSALLVGHVLLKFGSCLAITFGVMGWLGVPLYLTTIVVPIVLVTACLADEVYLVLGFRRVLGRSDVDVRTAVTESMRENGLAVVAATATTCVGFLACLASGSDALVALGAASAIGVALSLAFSLVVTPAVLALFGRRWARQPVRTPAVDQGDRWLRPVHACLRRPRATLAAAAAVTLVAAVGMQRVRVQDGWIECFSPRSAFREATERVARATLGVHLLRVAVSFDAATGPEPLLEPARLAAVDELESVLRDHAAVGGVVGLASQLRAMRDFWRLEPPRTRRDVERAYRRFDLSPGRSQRRRALTDERDAALVTCFVRDANYRDVASLMATAHAFETDRLRPLGGSIDFGGDVAVSQSMIRSIVRTNLASFPLAIAGVVVVLAVLVGSVRLALCAVLPVLISGAWVLGALGFMDVPLGVASSTFFVMSVGLGVDAHAVHFVAAHERLRASGVADPVREAVRRVAPAMVANTLAVAIGFGLLAASTVPPNRVLGLLVAAALLAGCAVTLTVVASTLELTRRSAGGATVVRTSPSIGSRSPGDIQQGERHEVT